MDFWEVLEKRHSVRSFISRENIPETDIEKILRAAILAPSAGNCQPWRFIIVRDPGLKKALEHAAYGQEFVSEAPVVIVVCAEPSRSSGRYGRRGEELYCLQDTAAAIEHILLAAVALGYGACWVGAFDERQAANVLQLSPQYRPVAIIPIGKPAYEGGRRPARRALKDVSEYR